MQDHVRDDAVTMPKSFHHSIIPSFHHSTIPFRQYAQPNRCYAPDQPLGRYAVAQMAKNDDDNHSISLTSDRF